MAVINDVGLIIFDCDGVVADSEPIATRVLQEGLAARGVRLTLDDVVHRFLGKSPSSIAKILRQEFEVVIDDAANEAMRSRLFELFRSELQAIEGVEAFLSSLKVPFCLASSSQMERIELALKATSLAPYFTGRIFNAAMVARGKPAPDLFLHAAREMDVAVGCCVVIEDSPAGIEAAKRAGMRVIGFLGGGHAQGKAHRQAVADAAPDYVADTMDEIAQLFSSPAAA